MRYFLTVVTISLNSLLSLVYAQGIIKGKVFDNNTLEPLHGVYVIYEKNKGTNTDQDGYFSFESVTGSINISFQFIGYRPVKKSINISSNDTIELNVGLDMEIQEIGQIVVSANRTEQKVAELSVSMDIIKSGDFLKTHITDAQELINKTPGIEVMDGQASIRGGSGFSYGVGSRVLALIDGLPVLSPDAGNIKWQFLPLENISQVEIIKGASSVLYGSSALNGIINFRTADATNIPVTRFFTETGIYDKPKNKNWVWWNTPRVFSTVSFSHLQKIGNTDLGVGINLLTDNGYRKFNDEKLGRISLRLKHHNEKIKGVVYGLNINSGYTAKRDFILWENSESGALKQDTSSVSLVHGSFLAIDPYLSFDKGGKFRHDLRIRLQSSNNRFPVRDENNSDAYSIYSEYQLYYKLSGHFNITAGLSENYSRVVSNFFGNHKGVNIASFAQMEANPVQRLKMVAGLRIEQNSLDDKSDKIVPIFRTGINWQAADYTFLRASFGQGYRYPSIAEKYASTTLGSVKIFPNPFVQSESGWNSEVGFKQGILMGKINGQADLSVFLSQNNNLIEYPFGSYPDPVTGLSSVGFRADNVEQSRVYGCELEFVLNRSSGDFNTSLSGGYTFIYPVEYSQITNKNTDIYLKYRRKHSAKISLNSSYKKFDSGVTFYVKSKILSIDDVFINETTRESILPGFYDYWLTHNTGYFLIDGNVGYKINKIVMISLAVKNITNTEYMGRPGDIQPQRNFSLRLSGTF
ncbi:MAG: TonB-dependent receptor [Bacteroidetes bacterium]|nr:MAG: TonB-dependent receptor [Bacteroidota bacterium]